MCIGDNYESKTKNSLSNVWYSPLTIDNIRLKLIRLMVMNETNLTPRLKFILNIISQTAGIDRLQIQDQTRSNYNISKPTLIRDLNILISSKLIRIEGQGKNTKYLPASTNPLLKVFDLEMYFSIEPDQRMGAKKHFDFSVFDYLKELQTQEEIEKIKLDQKSFAAQTQKLSPDILKRELERFVVELSWKSSKIEGNTYSLLETEALIKESQEAWGKSKEETIMILNHKDAFDQILKHKNDFKKISLALINQLHQEMTKKLGVTTGIRRQAVGITGTTYQPLDNEHQIHEAMEKMVAAINANPIPFEKALIANAMLAYIQPYTDGNKRTGRMLSNAILMAYDYYPLSYRNVNENELKQSLIIFYEQGTIHHLKKNFIGQLIFAFNTYFQ